MTVYELYPAFLDFSVKIIVIAVAIFNKTRIFIFGETPDDRADRYVKSYMKTYNEKRNKEILDRHLARKEARNSQTTKRKVD